MVGREGGGKGGGGNGFFIHAEELLPLRTVRLAFNNNRSSGEEIDTHGRLHS